MDDFETGVHLNYDAGFHFIRMHQGPEEWHRYGMGHGDGDECLRFQKGAVRLFNETCGLSTMSIPFSTLLVNSG